MATSSPVPTTPPSSSLPSSSGSLPEPDGAGGRRADRLGSCAGRRAVLAGAGAGAALALTGCAVYGGGGQAAAPAGPATTPAPAPGSGTPGDDASPGQGAGQGAEAPAPADGLARVDELPVGGGLVLADRGVVLTRPDEGTVRAFSTTCTHAGCAVNEVRDGAIRCPCHGSAFASTDGAVVSGPAPRPLPEIRVSVTDGVVTRA